MAREYPVKKGMDTSIEAIAAKCREFSENVRVSQNSVELSIPGIKRLEIWVKGKNLAIETENDENFKDFAQTIKIYNNLVESITGYSSKERKKKFSKI
ncbi:DUF5611 family protein [Oxyplasma meridianum]|uniref:DUF5611 family protein n=1 Tax=Oxyplasma meridianum TaxID=3073602 RepID=A0AAX4NGX2_9ARCH